MDDKRKPSVLHGTSTEALVAQMEREAAMPAFAPTVQIPSRTTAYKAYATQIKAQREAYQKKSHQRTPRLIEK